MGKLLKSYLMPHPPIMVSEVGRGEEKKISNTVDAAKNVAKEIKDLRPDTIVLIVPPHGPAFGDAMNINVQHELFGSLDRFMAPGVELKFDTNHELINIIMRNSAENNIPFVQIDDSTIKKYRMPKGLDHGSVVPLYFINKEYSDFKLVNITYGILSSEELYHFGSILARSIEESGSSAVLIASGDLSHRLTYDAPAGFSKEGREFDESMVKLLGKPDTEGIINIDVNLREAAGECGYRSILVMLGSLDGYDIEGKVLSYEGPFGVGYCVASYDILNKNTGKSRVKEFYDKHKEYISRLRNSEDEYVKLARKSLEHYIKIGKSMDIPKGLPDEMLNNKAGVFVSIKKHGQLRGCIGTIEGVRENIAEEIIENAISAGTRDPRFFPIEEDELEELEYSVDVLGVAEPIESKDQLDPKRYGVIVRKGMRSGLLLPNLEGVDTVDEQIDIALSKAGIKGNDKYTMERFEVVRHK